jgi:hypothetical protein
MSLSDLSSQNSYYSVNLKPKSTLPLLMAENSAILRLFSVSDCYTYDCLSFISESVYSIILSNNQVRLKQAKYR